MPNKDPFEEYRKDLVNMKAKSQETLEKQLTYLAGGTLVLSMAFIKDIVGTISVAQWKGLLLISWFLLVFALILNLISHAISQRAFVNTLNELSVEKFNPDKIDKRWGTISTINWSSLIMVVFGILLMIIFVTKNIYYDNSFKQREKAIQSSYADSTKTRTR